MTMTFIQSQVGDGSSNTVTFNSIPTNFTHLQLRCFARGVRSFSAEQIYLRFNNDTGSNYWYHYLYGDGSTQISGSSGSATSVILLTEIPAAVETANIHSAGVVDILDYRNTNKNKVVRAIAGHDNNGNTGVYAAKAWLSSGVWNNTTAITSLTVLSNGAFTSTSRFDLYGIGVSDQTGA